MSIFNKVKTKIENKMETGIITWGLKSFYAHTPTWAKHIITAVVSIIVGIYGAILINPAMFGPQFYSFWTEYSLKIGFIIVVACQATGVKCPLDKNGNPVTQPADRLSIADPSSCKTDA